MLDDIDRGILQILRKNARTSFLEIAKQLKVSESTVRKRVSRMESEGVIKKYAAIVEPSKIGYRSVAFIGIDAMPEKFLEVGRKLTELDNVKFVATSTGNHMLMVEVWSENSTELRNFIKGKIETIDGVTRTCPAILMEILKE